MSEKASSSSPALCPSCLAQNPAEAHFCARCNAPMSSMAAIDPIWRLWAQGHIVRKAVHRPGRRIVLIGIWLMFGPSVVALGAKLLAILSSDEIAKSTWEGVVTTVLVILLHGGALALLSTILYSTTRNFLRQRAREIEAFPQE